MHVEHLSSLIMIFKEQLLRGRSDVETLIFQILRGGGHSVSEDNISTLLLSSSVTNRNKSQTKLTGNHSPESEEDLIKSSILSSLGISGDSGEIQLSDLRF